MRAGSWQAVRIVKRNGRSLYGMLHPAASGKPEPGILILSPGIKNRVAPHRMYVKLSSRFQEMGYEVMRFDPEGLGDSEGEIDVRAAADLYGSIQTGRLVQDTVAAMDWMERERGISTFILSGLCGGAITGLLAGAEDSRVVGLLGLGVPVILDGSGVDHFRYVTSGQLKKLRKGYLKKIADPGSWLRLLTFRSNFRMLFKSMLQNRREPSNQEPIANFNPLFPKAFESFAMANRKMLLVFSGADRLYFEFKEKFLQRHEDLVDRCKHALTIHVTPGANHIFSFREWQEDMQKASCAWLDSHFPLS